MGSQSRFPMTWLVCCSACSTVDDQASARVAEIFGGESSHLPEVVEVEAFDPVTGAIAGHCTGTVIGHQTVLTAAHCVAGGFVAPELVTWGVRVRIGGVPRSVDRVAIATAKGDDVAILHLSEPAAVPTYRVLCWTAARDGDGVTIVGYGLRDELSVDGQRSGDFTVAGSPTADTQWFDVAGSAGEAACFFDSGAPVLSAGGCVAGVVLAPAEGGVPCEGPARCERTDGEPQSVAGLGYPTNRAWILCTLRIFGDAAWNKHGRTPRCPGDEETYGTPLLP